MIHVEARNSTRLVGSARRREKTRVWGPVLTEDPDEQSGHGDLGLMSAQAAERRAALGSRLLLRPLCF